MKVSTQTWGHFGNIEMILINFPTGAALKIQVCLFFLQKNSNVAAKHPNSKLMKQFVTHIFCRMEFTENIKRSCTSIDIIPGSDPNFNITYMIEMTCRKQSDSHTMFSESLNCCFPDMRQKRFTEYFPVLSWLLKQHNSRNMEKEDQKYIDMLEFSDKMLYLEEVLEMPSINLPFDDIANLINWNGTVRIGYYCFEKYNVYRKLFAISIIRWEKLRTRGRHWQKELCNVTKQIDLK